MAYASFESLLIWQKAEQLTLLVYTTFSSLKDYGYKDQIQRASISIMNNIAEGYEKPTAKDKIKFYYIAKGSCSEVRSMLHIGHKLGYLKTSLYEQCLDKCTQLSKMIYSFIQKTE